MNKVEQGMLRVVGVTKSYGGTTALEQVTLSVTEGESLAIMGPSGCGKSTLLHVLAGITSPDVGEVLFTSEAGVQNLVLLREEERAAVRMRKFGFVFQQGLLMSELTAAENVALPLMLAGTTPREAIARGGELLAQVGLSGLERRRIGQLSGGQAQRVAIARAIATRARIIFADEPTGALDSHTASEVLSLLLRCSVAQDRALVMVTHDVSVAERCDRIVRMSDGRVVSDVRVAG